jgi:hypothetical protein
MRQDGQGKGVRRERDGCRPAARARRSGRHDPDEVCARLAEDRSRHPVEVASSRHDTRTARGLIPTSSGHGRGPPRGDRSGPLGGHLPEQPPVASEGEPKGIVRFHEGSVHPPTDVIAGPPNGLARQVADTGACAARRRARLPCSGCPSLPADRAAVRSTRWRRSSRCSWRSDAARVVAPSSTMSAGTTSGAAMSGGSTRQAIPAHRRHPSAGRRNGARSAGGSPRDPEVGRTPRIPGWPQVGTASSGRGGSTSR